MMEIVTDNSKVIAELQRQNDELVASNARLLGQLRNVTDQLGVAMMSLFSNTKDKIRPHLEVANKAIYETPAQSLQHIEAAAVDKLQPNAEMKAEMIGESFFEEEVSCQLCDEETMYECEYCNGSGAYTEKRIVPWTLQKEIWQQMNAIAVRQLRQQSTNNGSNGDE